MTVVRTLARAALIEAMLVAGMATYGATLTRYTAVDLGQGTTAAGLNASGQVTGNVLVNGMDRAFITGADGVGMSVLATLGGPMSRATAINDSGQVVGYSWLSDDLKNGPRHAFVTGAAGQDITDLGSLGGYYGYCYDCSVATGINNAGVVVGVSGDTANNERIFVADPAHYTALRTIGSGNDWFYAGPINNLGWIAGTVNHGGDYRPVLVSADGRSILTIGEATDLRQPATLGINDAGRVVGNYFFESWQRDAFLTDTGGANLRRLVTLDAHVATAYDINNQDWIVGMAYPGTYAIQRAFVAAADGSAVADLNTLVSLPDGQVLNEAVGINDRGQIVANSGAGHAWLLTPVPEPAIWALWLAGLAIAVLRSLHRH